VVVVSSVAAVVAMAAVVDGGSVVAIVDAHGSSGGTIGAPRLVSLTVGAAGVGAPEERTTAAMLAAATRPTPAAMIPSPLPPSCRPAQVHRPHERCAGFDDAVQVGSIGRPGLRFDADRVVGRVERSGSRRRP
jgi:hypothetical protein